MIIPFYVPAADSEAIESYIKRLTQISYTIDYGLYSPELCVTGHYKGVDLIYYPADTYDTMLAKYYSARDSQIV